MLHEQGFDIWWFALSVDQKFSRLACSSSSAREADRANCHRAAMQERSDGKGFVLIKNS